MKKSIIALVFLSLFVSMGQAYCSEEKKEWIMIISGRKWNKDDEVGWMTNGFKLNTRIYGSIETKQRFPYSENARFILTVKMLMTVDYTLQLQMFDSNQNYLGYLNLVSEKNTIGKQVVKMIKFKDKIPEGTTSYSFKIWLGGRMGGFAEFGTLMYEMNEQATEETENSNKKEETIEN